MSRAARGRTLRTRVALATCVVVALALAGVGWFVDHETGRRALAALDGRVLAEAQAIATLTIFDGKDVEVHFEDETMTGYQERGSGAYFQVWTADRLVERSDSLGERDLPAPAPPPVAALPAELEPRTSWTTLAGPFERHVRAVALVSRRHVATPDGSEPGPGTHGLAVVVQVARTLEHVDEAQADVRGALSVVLPSALALATLGAFLAASRATRPLTAMGDTVRSVAEGTHDARIDLRGVDGELHALGLAVNNAFDAVAAVMARERRFSSDVAHELRTPVAVLRARIELALSRDRSPAEYREALVVARDAGLRLERLVEELLLLSRAEAGLPAHELVDVVAVVARAVDAVTTAAGLPREAITVRMAEPLPPVSGSGALLQRVIESLLENALRHGVPGPAPELRVATGSPEVCIEVLDRGPGFPEALRPHLFQRFARGDASRSRESGGTGLGLAIAHAIVAAHGGTIDAGAREGGGARVVVRLPCATG